jgi:hypothetical protein
VLMGEEGEGEQAVFCVKSKFFCFVYKKWCKFFTIVIDATKSKNQNYVINIIFF